MVRLVCFAALALILIPSAASAQIIPSTQPSDDAPHVYVITFGPGEDVWEKFGHNMLWIHDPQARAGVVDAAYNWGMFDFDAGYPFRFIAGSLTYWMDAYDAPRVLQEYIDSDRSTYVQEINLTPQQIDAIIAAVERNRRPENKYYKYDYYIDNCTTRVRDVLDAAVGGEIRKQLEPIKTGTTFRWHTHRLIADDWITDLALQFMCGPYCDRPIDAWQESFLPIKLMERLRAVKLPDGRPLILSEQTLHTSSKFYERATPPNRLGPYLLVGVIVAALICLPLRGKNIWARRGGWTIALAWCAFAGGGSVVLLYTWFLTRHIPPKGNQNLLPVNPLLLVLLVLILLSRRPKFARAALWVAIVTIALGLVGVLIKLLPIEQQSNGDILALALAINTGIAAALYWPKPPREAQAATASPPAPPRSP